MDVTPIIIALPIILESFPISSSGHALLFERMIARYAPANAIAPLPLYFDHLLHGPIALVLAIFFYPRWSLLVRNARRFFPVISKMLLLGFITESVTAIWYALLYNNKSAFPLALGFFITAILLASLRLCTNNNGAWNYGNTLLIGSAQGIALLPGISRFAAVYVVARWLGIRSCKAFELSFLIEFPLSVAAFLLGLYKTLEVGNYNLLNLNLLLIMLISSVLLLFSFYGIRTLIARNALWIFSVYMIGVTLLALVVNYG